MKKIALFCAVAAVAVGAIAGDGYKFKFSSTGDTYADGSAVLDGEIYALVWTKTGAFAGFNADGTLKDAANNAVMAMAPAEGGGCPTTVFIADESKDGGYYAMVLLDTRVATADAEGNVTKAPAGLSADGKLTAVNGSIAVENASFGLASAAPVTVDGAAQGMTAAAIDWANVPQPTVAGVDVGEGQIVLEVAGTVPYVQYTVVGGAAPGAIDATKPLATFLNGSAGGTVKLTVANPGANRFFKVLTK